MPLTTNFDFRITAFRNDDDTGDASFLKLLKPLDDGIDQNLSAVLPAELLASLKSSNPKNHVLPIFLIMITINPAI